MLSDDRAVNLASIGHYHIAFDQFWKHEQVDRCSWRVYPAELSGKSKLLRAKRPGDGDVGTWQFGSDLIVAREVHNLELGKVLAQASREPFGRIPELETVMEEDKEF